jgi:hypothetical protein
MSWQQVQAVGTVPHGRGEPGERGHGGHRQLVGVVAGVDDPLVVAVARDRRDGVARRRRVGRGHAEAPRRGPQRRGLDAVVERPHGGREVVHHREVHPVLGDERERLLRLVLGHQHPQVRAGAAQLRQQRDERTADGGGEPRDADGAGGFGVGVEVAAGRLDRGQDRDTVVGEPATGRGEPHAPAHRLQQGAPRLRRERRELLAHGGRGDAQLLADRAHRAQPGERHEQLQPARLH